jgi:hypothetical protein
MTSVRWVTHPRHLPKAPAGRVVVVDVAFAAGKQYEQKTRPLIEKLGDRLIRWVDHHEHRQAWPTYKDDARFLLIPNKQAHACPELITPALVAEAEGDEGPPDVILAHCDFDGAVAATKWLLGGREPWPGADEDARAVDSPGRGHHLSDRGRRLALAMDEATAAYDREARKRLMTAIVEAMHTGDESIALAEEVDTLARRAEAAEGEAERLASENGSEEAAGVYVVRMDKHCDNRLRRSLLIAAEERAPIGALYEPDKENGHWVIAATFDERLDLEEVKGFEGGRSDYRFARASDGGRPQIDALGAYLASVPA